MDVARIRLRETGLEELLEWLREVGRPQSLDSLVYQYIIILRNKVLEEEAEP